MPLPVGGKGSVTTQEAPEAQGTSFYDPAQEDHQ